jgi:hypothetical protein
LFINQRMADLRKAKMQMGQAGKKITGYSRFV